jgi:uncharacterized protein with HEPN domain
MPRDQTTVVDMLMACRRVVEFRGRSTHDEFLSDAKTQSAIVHQLLVLGEAAKRLSPEFVESHGSIPWRAIAGMRDRLVHAYDAIDLDEVWNTVARDIPRLTDYLEGIAPREPG